MSTKIVQLCSRGDNDFGLKEGENYYPKVGADGVVGLQSEIKKYVPKSTLATVDSDGLMSKFDKEKINKIKVEPLEGLKFKSPNGSIFILSVNNDGTPAFVKED